MSLNDSFVLYIFLWLVTNSGVVLSRHYYIREGDIPSYMYRKFDNVEEKIFPNFISISVSVSSVSGTLLYSMDKNMNQLIVTLRDNLLSDPPYGIEVELNKQYMVVSLSQLCTCQGCEFDVRSLLTLRIIINTHLFVTCNSGKSDSFKIGRRKGLDRNYPILYSPNNSNVIPINEAHMWLVNHPPIANTLPNPYQIYGCIFNVFYNNELIAFTNVSSNIGTECKKACTDDICNGGQCHVYYSGIPICNCTKTFLNGQFCNDSIQSMNQRADSLKSSFKMIKLSWKSDENNVFELKNEHIGIALGHKYKNLFFEYKYTERGFESKEVILSENYVVNTESIFIVYFHEKVIDIRLYNNKVWHSVSIPFPIDLSSQQFDSIILRSGKGTMDLVHKYHMDNMWSKLIFLKSKVMEEETVMNKHLIMGVTVPVLFLLTALFFGIIIYWKRKNREIARLTDRKWIDRCKNTLRCHTNDKLIISNKEWVDYIITKIGIGVLSVPRLDTLYDALKEAQDESEYSKNTAVLFIHVRIFVLPSMISQSNIASSSHNNRSLELFVTLLKYRHKYKHSLYLSEPMMDCLEDVFDIYNNHESIHPLIEALLALLAYWTVFYPDKYRRDTTFLQSYLSGDDSVKLWATVILCYYGDGWQYLDMLGEYLDNLRQYLHNQLETENNVSDDAIIIYLTLIRGVARQGVQWTLTDTDYRMIDGINNSHTFNGIEDISDNIVKLFIDNYKDGIIDSCNRNTSLTQDQKSSLKCLSVSLKNGSSNNYGIILSLLDELFPLLKSNNNNIAVMDDMVVSIIDYLYKYRRYRSEITKQRILSICQKYWFNKSVSDTLKQSLSNIIKGDCINKSDTVALRSNNHTPLLSKPYIV